MGYKQLDFMKRCQIYGLWEAGFNWTKIAKEVGVHKSTISREFSRNITFVRTKHGFWQYKPAYAQEYADKRHKKKPKKIKFTQDAEQFTREKLRQEWSPEQISGYAKRHQLFSVSHERIYQFILTDKQKEGDLYKHLRHQHKKYRKRYGSPKHKSPIKNRIFIDDRPKIVDDKSRIGDWEIDTIIGKNRKQAVVTIVERTSKKSIFKKVPFKTAELVCNATVSGLEKFSDLVFIITGDNGSEFASHHIISNALKADFYFAHPYSSWERGLNENTNGLLRQYLKKGSDFSNVTDDDLSKIMDKLNNRPRKTLGYATPNEIFFTGNKAVALIG
jgi:IS30 family transposase